MKRFIALVLSLVMALSLCAPAWAEGENVIADAIAAGKTEITLGEGEFTLPNVNGKDITLIGAGVDKTVVDYSHMGGYQEVSGSSFVFKNMTIKCAETGYPYPGLQHTTGVSYENCHILGTVNLFCPATFKNCTFDSGEAEHNAVTYGSDSVTFEDCKFTYADRSINCYAEGASSRDVEVTFINCEFTKVAGKDVTGAIETNSCFMNSLTLTITDCTVNEGDLWWVSTWDNKNGANTKAVIDGIPAGSVAQVGDEYFKTLAEAVAVGGEVVLLENITFTGNTATDRMTVDGGKKIVLDLNGKTLSAAVSVIKVDGVGTELTIKDSVGTGKVVPTVAGATTAALFMTNGAKATLMGGTLEGAGGYTVALGYGNAADTFEMRGGTVKNTCADTDHPNRGAAIMTGNNSGGSVTMTNGDIIAKRAGVVITKGSFTMSGGKINTNDGMAVSTNGQYDGTVSVADDSVITSTNHAAIYHASTGALGITGGTITGATGVYVKSGSVSITGGTITGNGAKVDYTYDDGGCNPTGDALVIENVADSESSGYDAIGNVSITGGNFVSTNGDAVTSVAAPKNDGVTAKDEFISGGTFSADPKAYVVDGYKAVEGNGVYTVMETYNVTFDANGGKGEYTLAPVVVGKLVLPENPFTAPEKKIFKAWSVDGVEYAAGASIDVAADVTVTAVWMNAPAPVEDTEVMVQVAPPEVTVSDKITGDALEIAQKVEVSEICTDAMTEVVKDVAKEEVTVKDEQVTELADKLNTTAEAIEDKVVVVVQTNFEVEIQDVIMDDNGAAAVKLDITPVYQKVVTTETVVESGAKVEVGKNAVAIEDEDAKGELDLKGQNVEITISIPEALVNAAASNGNKLYVTHTKDDAAKTSFVYEATVDPAAKTATFVNPNGFSSFTISATNSTVAYVEESGMNYATIESAIGDAGKGAVIEVLVSDQVVDITTACSFKLKLAKGVDEPTFNVAKGYTMSKWYVNGVYTYIVQSASAGGYAPVAPSTPEKVVTSADTFDAGIALYVGMSVMAAVGSAVVLKKRED